MARRGGARAVTRHRRSQATRDQLERAARQLFAARGYAAVPVDELSEHAGVTSGSLYHHYGGKAGLFRVVAQAIEGEVAERVLARAWREPRPELHLEIGCEALLDEFLDPEVRQILLIDGPSVLGWESWRAMDERHGLQLLETAVGAGVERGYLVELPAKPLAQLLLGALTEAGLRIARADDLAGARRGVGRALEHIIAGLKA